MSDAYGFVHPCTVGPKMKLEFGCSEGEIQLWPLTPL